MANLLSYKKIFLNIPTFIHFSRRFKKPESANAQKIPLVRLWIVTRESLLCKYLCESKSEAQ